MKIRPATDYCRKLLSMFIVTYNLLLMFKKETLAQMLSCEFCKNFQGHLFHRTPPDDCFWIVLTLSYLKREFRYNLKKYIIIYFKNFS